MESMTKMRLSPEQLDSIVKQACGAGIAAFKELTDGWANAAYDIVMDDGRTAILKVAPPGDMRTMRYEKQIMIAEVEVMKLIAGKVPVPRILAYDNSLSLVPTEYFLMERLQGIPYNQLKEALSEDERAIIEEELGGYNAEINKVRGRRFGYYSADQHSTISWKDTFTTMILGVLADGSEAGVELPASTSVIEAAIAERSDCLNEVIEPHLLHWDLWDGNVFVHDGHISGIIDFERALWGDPLMEYYFGHFTGSAAFLRGYGNKVLTENEQMRRGLYDLYLDLILWIECAYRKYENPDHLEWARENLDSGWTRFLSLRS